ncbi:MAG: type II secretion system minor pseudopilin GspJ [Pseudomonadales bacterium]
MVVRKPHSVARMFAPARGFTLLEVLIAVALTALVGVIAYGFLDSAMRSYEGHSVKAKRLNEINLFFSMLSRDIVHAIDRPIRDENGETEDAMEGGFDSQYLLALTRGGWPNPRELPRSDLQRIAYGLNDTRIERIAWPVLDRVDSENVFKSIALEGVNNVVFRFLMADDVIIDDDQVSRDWQESWPVNIQGQQGAGLPKAVEVTVDLEGWGELRRLYALDG